MTAEGASLSQAARDSTEVLSIHICSRMMTYADVCMCDVAVVKRKHRGALYSRKLTYADVCTCHKRIHCRMLTYVGWGGVGWGGRYSRGQEV